MESRNMSILNKILWYTLLNILLVLPVYSAEKENTGMTTDSHNENFELMLASENKDWSSIEIHGRDLYLTVYDPHFLINDGSAQPVREGRVPMVGAFKKILSSHEMDTAKQLADYLLNNRRYIAQESNINMLIKIVQDNQELKGGFLANDEDKENALFLRKQANFISNLIADVNKFTPCNALSFRHSTKVIDNEKLLITLYIKNIGQERIQLHNPSILYDAYSPAPHLVSGIVLQIASEGNSLGLTADYRIRFEEEQISQEVLMAAQSHPAITFLPNEEKQYPFVIDLKEYPSLMNDLNEGKKLSSNLMISLYFKITETEDRIIVTTNSVDI